MSVGRGERYGSPDDQSQKKRKGERTDKQASVVLGEDGRGLGETQERNFVITCGEATHVNGP